MNEVSTIGVDLAKNVFQLHGAGADGSVLFRRRVRRAQFLEFFEAHERCIVAMEACPGAHHWGRQLRVMGYEVRLIAPAYVKPFVKRQKNDQPPLSGPMKKLVHRWPDLAPNAGPPAERIHVLPSFFIGLFVELAH